MDIVKEVLFGVVLVVVLGLYEVFAGERTREEVTETWRLLLIPAAFLMLWGIVLVVTHAG